jgi:hypothetical protein
LPSPPARTIPNTFFAAMGQQYGPPLKAVY